jgi:aminomethyltransferase
MLKTPLNEFHRQQGARLVDFAGWEMPVMYTGVIEEHMFTREHCTMFDVSHMGRVEFRGPGAATLLQRLSTRNI